MFLTGLLMLILLVPGSNSYPYGAPPGSCNAMAAKHGASAQTVASPYTITPSANTYDCGDTVNVTIGGTNFKGFLCQARPDASIYTTVGSLTNIDNLITTNDNCTEVSALTHTENGDKTSFQFSWTHSGASTDDIYIVCTIVQHKTTFWRKLTSSAITYSGSATTCSANGTDHAVSSVIVVCICILLNMVKIYM